MKTFIRSAIFVNALIFSTIILAQAVSQPTTEKRAVVTEYHGVKVSEDYRWLEDSSNPEVAKWTKEQSAYARFVLDPLPALDPVRKRLTDLNSKNSPDYFGLDFVAGKLFAMKFQPPKNQPILVWLKSPESTKDEHVILDPNKLDAKGQTTIDFFIPSLDGRLIAVSLSENGTESGNVHIYDTANGHELSDVVPRVNGGTAGGGLAWNQDATGFYYTRYPRDQERAAEDMNFYQQIYFHKLGTPTTADVYSLGKDFPRIAEIKLASSPKSVNAGAGKYTMAIVANGDGGEFAHYILGPSGVWQQITQFSDQVKTAVFGLDNAIYLISHNQAPRGKVLRMPLSTESSASAVPPTQKLSQSTTIVPESEVTIEDIVLTPKRIYTKDLAGGPSQIRAFELNGNPQPSVSLPPISAANQILRLDDETIIFRSETFITPPAWYRFEPKMDKPKRTALFRVSPADFSDYEVLREFATSKDGTKVPLNIIKSKQSSKDGKNTVSTPTPGPTILSAYGGYGISLTPRFSVNLKAWLEQGGTQVIANIRGGGEFGESWHKAGNLTNKQNVFDDFLACAEYLVQRKYATTSTLAIEGGSNGGLLMGAALTQRPDLFRAVVSHVGIYDMLRVELHPNGAFNVTEFGTVKDPAHFKAMMAYSPYHHVTDKTSYPAVLLLTGENDPRVDPANSRKMAARLQAANASKYPILLRTTEKSGHGIGSSLSERIAKSSDVYAFLFDQLGVQYKTVGKTISKK